MSKLKGYFYKDKDQAFMVSDSDFKDIQGALMRGEGADTSGRILYPVFDKPTKWEIEQGKARTPAYMVRDGQLPTLRWYWQIREHKRTDHGCIPVGDGLCGFKMVRFMNWNAEKDQWELEPMVNHADSAQEKVLDSK